MCTLRDLTTVQCGHKSDYVSASKDVLVFLLQFPVGIVDEYKDTGPPRRELEKYHQQGRMVWGSGDMAGSIYGGE